MTSPIHFRESSHSKTKIVATLGPASDSQEMIEKLLHAGVDVFRVNAAHGSQDYRQTLVENIRAVGKRLNNPIGILLDLGGPKIRLGQIPNDEIDCQLGEVYRYVRGEKSDNPKELTCNYKLLIDELAEGNRVMLADGTVAMEVITKTDDYVEAKVTQPGIIRTRQGINLPGAKISIPALTDKDREDAEWAAKVRVDFVGLSFVRSAAEVDELKGLLGEFSEKAGQSSVPWVIAKIEKGEALDNLEAIVSSADGIMVARGDLGVEIDVARLPVEQKRVIATCNRYQKPVITATQMLDSMQHSTHPTRAEATDVANAILDGTDACMLSGETAVGNYPVAAVEMMNRIALATEPLFREFPPLPLPDKKAPGLEEVTKVVVHNAGRVAEQLDSKMLVVATHSGASALAMAKGRHFVPVLGVSDSLATLRRICLFWGVTPVAESITGDSEELLQAIERWGNEKGTLFVGDSIVLVASTHWSSTGHNQLIVHEVLE